MNATWKVVCLVAPVLFAATGSAHSLDYYCRSSRVLIHNGGEYQVDWQVVNMNARRVQMPGQTKPTKGCGHNWRSLSAMYKAPEIIQAPKLGHVRVVNNYRIYYESAKSGADALAVRVHWIGASTGQLQSAVVRYNITIGDKPL